jgi:hypothetical protein
MKDHLLKTFLLVHILKFQNLEIKLLKVYKEQMILNFLNGDHLQNIQMKLLIKNLMIYLIGIDIFMNI